MFFQNFSLMFSAMSLLFLGIFLLVTGIILAAVIKGIRQWNRNNHAPRLTVPATVVAKREYLSHNHHHHHNQDHMHHMHSTTSHTFFATFQLESGDRMELMVPGMEFGLLVEGDRGMLTFQGTRYLEFQRASGYESQQGGAYAQENHISQEEYTAEDAGREEHKSWNPER